MYQITASVLVPVTINWTQNGEPAGETTVTIQAGATRVVEDYGPWGAVGNWAAGQADAAIQLGGTESIVESGSE